MNDITIIDNPSLKGFFRNMGEWSFTMLMWGLWIYLFLPILNILLWLFGIRHFYIEVIEEGGYLELLDLIQNIGWIILIVFAILRLWGYYNYKKFGQLNRRKFPLSTSTETLSNYFKVPVQTIQELRGQKEVLIDTESDVFRACYQ